jgi:hypothetical protein
MWYGNITLDLLQILVYTIPALTVMCISKAFDRPVESSDMLTLKRMMMQSIVYLVLVLTCIAVGWFSFFRYFGFSIFGGLAGLVIAYIDDPIDLTLLGFTANEPPQLL